MTTQFRLNARIPEFAIATYFVDRYGLEKGSPRGWRYREVSHFLATYREQMIEQGLAKEVQGGIDINDKFLQFILDFPLGEDERIPDTVMQAFDEKEKVNRDLG